MQTRAYVILLRNRQYSLAFDGEGVCALAHIAHGLRAGKGGVPGAARFPGSRGYP